MSESSARLPDSMAGLKANPCPLAQAWNLAEMELFPESYDPTHNLLPRDGEVFYLGPVFAVDEADAYLAGLIDGIPWQRDEVMMFGKRVVTRRETAWYGDEPYAYTYSQVTKRALPWTRMLRVLKQRVEGALQETFNSCLLNLYHDGSEGMGWHSDDEQELKPNGTIVSLSFGARRKFAFKHKSTRETVSLFLEHGSLLAMQGVTQRHWQHRLPPMRKVAMPRVNLTFRTINRNGCDDFSAAN